MSAVSVASASHFTPTACAAVSAFGSSSRVMYESFSQRRTKRPRAKKVSWAPDERLCQVRTFASDDAPSQFCMSMFRSQQGQGQQQMHYQQQQQQMERNNMPSLPPGFGPRPFTRPNNSLAAVAAMTAQLTWRSPDAVDIPPSWRVVAGNESNEVAVQKERENRVLEAVYPRPSAIPDSPAEPVTAEEDYDDGMTPSISVVAQEDEEMAEVQEGGDGEHNEMRAEEPTSAAREGNQNMSPWVAASQGQGMASKTSRGGGGSSSRAHGNASSESCPPASMEVEGPLKDCSDESLRGVVSMSPEWESSSVRRAMWNVFGTVVNGAVGAATNGTVGLQSPVLSAPASVRRGGDSNGVVVGAAGVSQKGRGDGCLQKREQQEAVVLQTASSGASGKATVPPPSAADITMVAAAVLAALGGLGGSGVDNMIDQGLLLQILKNPSIMNTLLPPGGGEPKSDTVNILGGGDGSCGGVDLPSEGGTNLSAQFPTPCQGLAAAADGKQRGSGGGSESEVKEEGIARQGQGQPLGSLAPVKESRVGPASAGGGRCSSRVAVHAPAALKTGCCPGEGGAAASTLRNGVLAASRQCPSAAVQVVAEQPSRGRAVEDDLPLLPPGFENSAGVRLQNGGNDIGGGMQSLRIGRMMPAQSNSSWTGGQSAGDARPSPDGYPGRDVDTTAGMAVSDVHGPPPTVGPGCQFPLPFVDTSTPIAGGMLPEDDLSGRVGTSGVGVGVQRAGPEGVRYRGGGGAGRGMTGRGRGHFGANRYAREWTVDHADAGGSREGSGFELGEGPETGYMSAGAGDMGPGYHGGGGGAGGGRSQRLSKVPCAFFGTSTGCRNGSRCPFLHDPAVLAGRGSLPMQRLDNDDHAIYHSVAPNSTPFAGGPPPPEGDRRPRSSAAPSSASLWSCTPRSNGR